MGDLSSFLSVKEVATYLALKISTVYLLVESKQIPHYRIGRLIRFKLDEINEWMADQKQEVVDIKVETRRVSRLIERRSSLNVDAIAKKAIDGAKGRGYNSGYGKPDHFKGLGKEVEDGTL